MVKPLVLPLIEIQGANGYGPREVTRELLSRLVREKKVRTTPTGYKFIKAWSKKK